MESVREARVSGRSRCFGGSAQTHVSSNVDPCADSLTLCAENLALCVGNLAAGSHFARNRGDVFADKPMSVAPCHKESP